MTSRRRNVSGSRVEFARTLALIEEQRGSHLALSIAGVKRPSATVNRIRRLVGQPVRQQLGVSSLISSLVLAVLACVLMIALPVAADKPIEPTALKAASRQAKQAKSTSTQASQTKAPLPLDVEKLHRDLVVLL